VPGGKETAKKEAAKKEDPKEKGKETAKKDEPKGGSDDKEAADLLSKAKVQIGLKQTDKAKATLDEIISKYPDSKQAADAKKLLEKLGK
jgi:TolA-binding protein